MWSTNRESACRPPFFNDLGGQQKFEPRPPHAQKAFKINVFVGFEGFFHARKCTTGVLSKYFAGSCLLNSFILRPTNVV